MLRLASLFYVFCLTVCTSLCQADAPVWKVTKNGHSVYLGGTFHMLSQEDHPLPKVFNSAYQKASELIFETDIEALQTPEYQLKLLNAMTAKDGKRLQQKLSPTTYQKLNDFFTEQNIPAASFAYMKPAGVALTIAVMEYKKHGMQAEFGVDQYFSTLAKQDKKTLGYLNDPDEHIAFIANLGEGMEDEVILQTLADIAELETMTESLKIAWRNGDMTTLEKKYLDPIKKDFPAAYDTLFVKRNNHWVPQILRQLKDEEVEFVLVGAMHMVGEQGLVEQLKKAGCKVSKL